MATAAAAVPAGIDAHRVSASPWLVSARWDLLVFGGFEVRTGLWLSRPERPFGLAVLFLGGGGWFVAETGGTAAAPALALLRAQSFLVDAALLPDAAGQPRFLVARRA